MDAPEHHTGETAPDIDTLLFDTYRRLSAPEKLDRVGSLGRMVQSVVMAELRARHPDADERELRLRYAERLLDTETMRTVFDWPPTDEASRPC